MNKHGGYTWLQTCATVVCSSKNADEQNIICVNYVVSNRENENLILDCIQLENGLDTIKHEEPLIGDNGAGSPGNDPANDGPGGGGNGGGSGRLGDIQKSPKSETPEPKSRARHLSNSSSAAAVHNNGGATALVIDAAPPISQLPDEHPQPVRKGHKRKLKALEAVVAADGGDMEAAKMTLAQLEVVPRLEEQQQHSESSVKELENAMSKHLPLPAVNSATTTDFSTDSLLKQQQQQQHHQQAAAEKSSTIQWIGAHHHNPFHQQAPTMPATALLRQLYANRESVIRATARQSSGGVFYSGKLNLFFFFCSRILTVSSTDGQTGPLPTPPGSESSFDNQFLLHGNGGGGGGHAQKSGDAFTNLVSTYGGYPGSMDYHNAMTPPSSVSPREPSAAAVNKTSAMHSTNGGYDFADSLRSQYGGGGGNTIPVSTASVEAPTLPLKPQPYSAAAAMHHAANSIEAYGSSLDQSQYFSHHSGFHLYHKGAPTSGWYTTPS